MDLRRCFISRVVPLPAVPKRGRRERSGRTKRFTNWPMRGTRELVARASFHHEAVFYDGERSYLDRLLPFLREGAAAGEPMLVAVSPAKIRLLADALGAEAEQITFVPMDELGRNPARIIPAWRAFADRAGT